MGPGIVVVHFCEDCDKAVEPLRLRIGVSEVKGEPLVYKTRNHCSICGEIIATRFACHFMEVDLHIADYKASKK